MARKLVRDIGVYIGCISDDLEIDLVSNGSIDVNLDFIKVSNIYKSSGGRGSSESSRQLKCSAGVFIHLHC